MKENGKLFKRIFFSLFFIAIVYLGYMIHISKMTSYLSSEPKACINCHVMNTQYATWKHSSHGVANVTCVECHLPTDGFFEKYKAKSIDGWNHSVAFTMDSYDHAMKISEYGAERVQNNCLKCHSSLASEIISNADKYHNFDQEYVKGGRKCWDCHKNVPHGKVRSIVAPDILDIKSEK